MIIIIQQQQTDNKIPEPLSFEKRRDEQTVDAAVAGDFFVIINQFIYTRNATQ